MKRFTITIECVVDLDADRIWPDGDGPAEPTAEDVRELIEQLYREPHEIIEEWSLVPHVIFEVAEVKS